MVSPWPATRSTDRSSASWSRRDWVSAPSISHRRASSCRSRAGRTNGSSAGIICPFSIRPRTSRCSNTFGGARSIPERLEAFVHLIKSEMGFRLHEAVRRAKFELSVKTEALFEFHCEPVSITKKVTASSSRSGSAEVELMAGCVDRLLSSTGVSARDIDHVFLTGWIVVRARRAQEYRSGSDRSLLAAMRDDYRLHRVSTCASQREPLRSAHWRNRHSVGLMARPCKPVAGQARHRIRARQRARSMAGRSVRTGDSSEQRRGPGRLAIRQGGCRVHECDAGTIERDRFHPALCGSRSRIPCGSAVTDGDVGGYRQARCPRRRNGRQHIFYDAARAAEDRLGRQSANDRSRRGDAVERTIWMRLRPTSQSCSRYRDGLRGSRVLDGRYGVEQLALGIPKGREQAIGLRAPIRRRRGCERSREGRHGAGRISRRHGERSSEIVSIIRILNVRQNSRCGA